MLQTFPVFFNKITIGQYREPTVYQTTVNQNCIMGKYTIIVSYSCSFKLISRILVQVVSLSLPE